MATKVYGASDDLVEFEGDVHGEIDCYGTDDDEHGVLLVFSDGTLAEAKYGKLDLGIWQISVLQKGKLFLRVDDCDDEDADPYSDVLQFKGGLKWCIAAKQWERVK